MSSTKIKRTTMLPQVYLETKEDHDISNIFERNNNSNEKILNGTVKLTTKNCKDICHKVPKLYDIVELADNVFLDIFDIPGLNDSKTEKIYYKYIDDNFSSFDIILIMVDINESFNTSSSIKLLENVIKNARKTEHKTYHICIIVNKCDDLELDSNNELIFMNEEHIEMYKQVEQEVNSRLQHIKNIKYNIFKMSAEDSYIYRMYNNNPNVKLDSNFINKFGMNEFGKRRWNEMNLEEQNTEIQQFLSKCNMDNRLKLCGYTDFRNYLLKTIDYQVQYKMLIDNLFLDIDSINNFEISLWMKYQNIFICTEYRNICKSYSKVYDIYSSKCDINKVNILHYINVHFKINIKRLEKLSKKVTAHQITDHIQQINKIKVELQPSDIDITECAVIITKLIKKQNDLIIEEINKDDTFNNISSIIKLLERLKENNYNDFINLITKINKTIHTKYDLITPYYKNKKHPLINYIKLIESYDYPLQKCLEFITNIYMIIIPLHNYEGFTNSYFIGKEVVLKTPYRGNPKLSTGIILEIDLINDLFKIEFTLDNISQQNTFQYMVKMDNINDEIVDKCNILFNMLMYHKSLLNLEFNKIDYGTYDEEFENFLLDLKTFNDIQQIEFEWSASDFEFTTRQEKRNIMSLFHYMLELYERTPKIDLEEESDKIQQAIDLSTIDETEEISKDYELQQAIKLSIEADQLHKNVKTKQPVTKVSEVKIETKPTLKHVKKQPISISIRSCTRTN
jgi:hypothetical protein